jgi:hypothetical protein
VAEQEVVIVQGPAFHEHPDLLPLLADGRCHLVADLYDPITLELLAVHPGRETGHWLHLAYRALLNEQLRVGDFFLCANERQRDYWLGALDALGRLGHDEVDGADVHRLLAVVPFGLPAEPPVPGKPVLKGVIPGLDAGDRLILWGGGLWDWLDPLTPIRAMERVIAHHPTARLAFFTTAHAQMDMPARARRLAAEMGLLDKHVLFADWIPPDRWGRALLEADVGLSFHPESIEAHLAFRTRLLDYIWSGLPIVTAAGDVLSDVVTAHGLGHVVQPGDVEGLAESMVDLLDEGDARGRRQGAFRRVAARFTWDEVSRPLARYCRAPWRALDREDTFVEHWQAAGQDRQLAELGHAKLQQDASRQQVATLQQEMAVLRDKIDEMESKLVESRQQLDAAMGGRVMRLMTHMQRALRRLQQGRQ